MSTEGTIFGSEGWWEPDGPHNLLHVLNPVRMAYLRERLGTLSGLRIADIGCGGGILTEQLAIAGAQAIGIDPSAGAIQAATAHAAAAGLPINYRNCDARALATTEGASFDAVVCMEVLEHMTRPSAEIQAMARLLKPGGSAILATINRTAASWIALKLGAELLLQALPIGSHDWSAFIQPGELASWCAREELATIDIVGANWSFFGKTFLLSRTRCSVNYFLHARKDN